MLHTLVLLATSLLPYSLAAPQNVSLHERAPSGTKVVIANMFEWSWTSVASECTNFLGPAGYGFVQVSPPQEHTQGTQWWTYVCQLFN